MFDALSRLFTRPDQAEHEPPDPQLAVAALLVHLTAVDGEVTDEECAKLRILLQERYDLTESQVAELIALATRKDRESVDYYAFTASLARLEEAERLRIIEMMWELVFADAEDHELEDNMVWRVAELIHISARQRTVLRARVRRRVTGER
jgi:uncharacterized tellurite resistance protein B-like protein